MKGHENTWEKIKGNGKKMQGLGYGNTVFWHFFVCCKVCWGLSREALEMELLLYKVRPKYHQLLGSEETSILSAHGAGTILCWPFFWCGESKAWPFGHRPKPILQPNGIKHIWWWRFCRKNKEIGTNVPTYVSRLPVPRKIRSLCVLPVAATVDGLMINWYMFQT